MLNIFKLNKLIFLLVVLIVFLSCRNSEKDFLKDIDTSRVVYTGEDSLMLFPFEMFSNMSYDSTDLGLYQFLIFHDIKTKREFYFGSHINDFEFYGSGYDVLTLKLKTLNGEVVREIKKGETYKVIFSYQTDNEMTRDEVPGTDAFSSGYQIVDIKPKGSKFYRQNQ